MTTDRWPKFTSRNVGNAVVAGIAKGAGMIEPNMATMLVYLMTDAELPEDALKPMLKRVVDKTFNAISIDTDTSTSDTVVLMANGLAGNVGEKEHLVRRLQLSGEQLCRPWLGVRTKATIDRVMRMLAQQRHAQRENSGKILLRRAPDDDA